MYLKVLSDSMAAREVATPHERCSNQIHVGLRTSTRRTWDDFCLFEEKTTSGHVDEGVDWCALWKVLANAGVPTSKAICTAQGLVWKSQGSREVHRGSRSATDDSMEVEQRYEPIRSERQRMKGFAGSSESKKWSRCLGFSRTGPVTTGTECEFLFKRESRLVQT